MFKSRSVKEGSLKSGEEEIKQLVSKREIVRKIDEVSIVRAQSKEVTNLSEDVKGITSFAGGIKKKVEEIDRDNKERSIGLAIGGTSIGTFLGMHMHEIINASEGLLTSIGSNSANIAQSASQILGILALPLSDFVTGVCNAGIKMLETIELATKVQLPLEVSLSLGGNIALLAVGMGALAFAAIKTDDLNHTKNELREIVDKFKTGLRNIKDVPDNVKHLGSEIAEFAEELAKSGGRRRVLAGSIGLGMYLGPRLYEYLSEMPGLDALGTTLAPHNLPNLVFLLSSTALTVWEIANAARRYVKNNNLKNALNDAFSKLNQFKEKEGKKEVTS